MKYYLSPNGVAIIFSIIIAIVWILIHVIYVIRPHEKKYEYYRELPNDLELDFIQYLYDGQMTFKVIWVTFLNLIRKGAFQIKKISNDKGTYLISFVQGDYNSYEQHEKDFIEWINTYFNSDENGNKSVDLDALGFRISEGVDHTDEAYNFFLSYKKNIQQEAEQKYGKISINPSVLIIIPIVMMIIFMYILTSFNTSENNFLVSFLGFTTLLFLLVLIAINYSPKKMASSIFVLIFAFFQIGNIYCFINAGMLAMIIPYLLTFGFIMYFLKVKKHTKIQRDIINKLNGLKNFIKDFSELEKSEFEQIKLWDCFFVLTIIFNINRKKLNGYEFLNYNDLNNTEALYSNLYNIKINL